MVDEVYVKQYTDLLIKQYWDKSKAKSEITAYAELFEPVYTLFDAFFSAFDIDKATGDRLDKIGSWVGLSRIIPNGLPKVFFGFDGYSNAQGFSDLSDPSLVGGPMYDLSEPTRSNLELNDVDYRFFLRAKIAKNACQAVIKNNTQNAIQDVINDIFNNGAYVTDTYKMKLMLYIFGDIDTNKIALLEQLDLLPRPQGVRYVIIKASTLPYFGFAGDTNAKGFSDLIDPSVVGGKFATLI